MGIRKLRNKILPAKTIAVDTMVFIYLLEGHESYLPLVKVIFELMEKGGIEIISSFISYIETLSSPHLDPKRIEDYSNFFLKSKKLTLYEVNWEISAESARLRRVCRLRIPDAIQMATAIVGKADYFISNDESFKRVKEMKTLVLKDFV